MNLVEVYLANAKPFHTCGCCSLKFVVSEVGSVDLGCNNELIPADVSQSSSYNLLTMTLPVNLGSVYKIHSEFVGPRNSPDYLLVIALPEVASLPNSDSYLGDLRTIPS